MLACPKADGFIQPALTGKTLAQPHAVVNAVVDCQLMRYCLISSLSMQTIKKLCRGEHCSPVPVFL